MLGRAISEYKYQPPPSSQSSQATAKIAALKQSGGNVAPKPADGSLKETPKRNTSSISGWTANSSSRAANPIARTSGLQSLPGTYSSRPSEDRKRSYNTMAGSEAAARTPSSFEKVNNWNVSRPRTNRQGVIDLEADVVDLTNDEAPQRSHLPATKVVEYDWDDDIENDSEIDIDMEYPLQLPKAPPVQPLPPVSGNDYAPQSQSASSMLPPKTPINSRGLPIPSSAQTWSSSPAAHLSKPDPPREMRQAHEIDLIQPESSEPPRAAKRRTTPWAQKAAEQPAKRTAEPPVEKAVCTVPYESCYVCEEPGHVAADCPKHPKKQRAEAAAARNSFTPLPQDTSLPWNGNAKGARTRDMDIKKYQKTVRSAKNAAAHADMFAAAATVHDEKHPHVKAQTSKEKAAPQIFLSKEQQDTLNLVIEKKKSVFFTGSAGTGKSVLMRAIIADLQRTHKREPEKVAVTASTGLAACNIGGVTLHSFSGIGLGKEDVPVLVKKIMRNQKAKNRWLKCKVLVIDEISMVDGDLFDKLEAIARSMKKNSRPFGGIQLVVTGDFFQLPPVPDYGSRNIKFAFDADTWSTSIHHTIGLTEVFRQRDPVFANMLNEMRLGRITDETLKAFRRLDRPLPPSKIEATELFPTRNEVENANFKKMKDLSGKGKVYIAEDAGTVKDKQQLERLLQNFMAPKVLELKKGAQVMLIKNMDEGLVNGSLGRIVRFASEPAFNKYVAGEVEDLYDSDRESEISEEAQAKIRAMAAGPKLLATSEKRWPVVSFVLPDGAERELLCMPEDWKVELPNGEVQAQRRQIPLILAWALSIHKAQGQTLERVKVDLRRVFENGQAYVALSRATTQEGLWVQNFNAKAVMAHPRVGEFYNSLYSVNKALMHPKVAAVEKEKEKVKAEKKVVEQFDEMPDDLEMSENEWDADEEAFRSAYG